MSISEQITALQNDKTAIANAIVAKGGTVNTGDGFDDFATDIATIPSGGSATEPYREDTVATSYSGDVEVTNCVLHGYNDIPDAMFENYYSLQSVNLSDNNISSIGSYAFSFCEKLTSIVIPSTVSNIKESAFNQCQILTSITFTRSTVPTIGSEAFKDLPLSGTVYIPTGMTTVYKTALEAAELPTSWTYVEQ